MNPSLTVQSIGTGECLPPSNTERESPRWTAPLFLQPSTVSTISPRCRGHAVWERKAGTPCKRGRGVCGPLSSLKLFAQKKKGVLTAPTGSLAASGRADEGRPLPKASPGPSTAPQPPAHPAPG